MRKNKIRHITMHVPNHTDVHILANRVGEFHIDMIERRLNQSDLTAEEKVTVIDKIINTLKSREVNGFIK